MDQQDRSAKIAELKQQHGEIIYIELPKHGLVAWRKPNAAEHDRFVDGLARGKTAASSMMKQLVATCAVHPQGDAFLSVLEDMPGLAERMSGELLKLVGSTEDIEVKKA